MHSNSCLIHFKGGGGKGVENQRRHMSQQAKELDPRLPFVLTSTGFGETPLNLCKYHFSLFF